MDSHSRRVFAVVLLSSLLAATALGAPVPERSQHGAQRTGRQHQQEREQLSPLAAFVQSLVQKYISKAILGWYQQIINFPSTLSRTMEAVQKLRVQRGDTEGAVRLEVLKAWSSLTGFTRGLPALAADLIKHRTILFEVAQDWVHMAAEAEAKARGAPGSSSTNPNVPATPQWSRVVELDQRAVSAWAQRALDRASRAFQSSALHTLLSDVATELRLDRQHFVGDVLGQLMGGPGRVSAELRAAVQQVADTVAASFPGGARAAPASPSGLGGAAGGLRGEPADRGEL